MNDDKKDVLAMLAKMSQNRKCPRDLRIKAASEFLKYTPVEPEEDKSGNMKELLESLN